MPWSQKWFYTLKPVDGWLIEKDKRTERKNERKGKEKEEIDISQKDGDNSERAIYLQINFTDRIGKKDKEFVLKSS